MRNTILAIKDDSVKRVTTFKDISSVAVSYFLEYSHRPIAMLISTYFWVEV